ncbi:CAP domain-containing protein [Arthrospiribacter ruber]|uniref:CAP domain-containing protein n=1 Tax=Arthrospiribacter ruber TaxID=2487934 RepID=A0A951IXC9_9BACT|nr:CAP domain-containing protein [Arthrospiribacter ruber]MBW3467253.1 CAP domain-containing protein [Arthrospiribacter ruber]
MKKLFSAFALFSLTLIALSIFSGCESKEEIKEDRVSLSPAEMELYSLLMTYRAELGLPEIPLSTSMTIVAQTHVKDLQENNPMSGECNSHSWSEFGDWTPCCYTADHSQAACMWNKPRELTKYTGNGFEIAAYNMASINPSGALNAWKNSPGHDAVIRNDGPWNQEWKAIGIGINGRFATVWFGREADPAGIPG